MPINFACICPHPPIIIPEIGGRKTKKVIKTVLAMEKLAEIMARKEPEILIVISPHGLVYPDRFNVCGMEKLAGDFNNFGAPEVQFKFKNDLDLAEKIDQVANNKDIKTLLYGKDEPFFGLDHGTLVPLYFLTQKLTRPIKIVPIAYSSQNQETHLRFGKILFSILHSLPYDVGLVASGDLSHRLLPISPAGYNESGKKFDQELIQAIKNKDIETILSFNEDFVEAAGECGLRSILILLGALSNIEYKPEVLSYEGPFGVGYAVINFELLNSDVKGVL